MEALGVIVGGKSGRSGRAALALAPVALAVACLALAAAPSGLVDGADAAKAKKPVRLEKLFNTRYCEIFGVNPAPSSGFSVKIFNTVGLNYCPEPQWAALDFSAIAASEGWLIAAPNGPRHWLIDEVYGAKPTNPKTFGGIKMRQVATLESATLSPPPFTQFDIARKNTWVFKKGRTIYTLTDPFGNYYVMQAYTKTVDPSLNPNTLKNLASNPTAAIPAGWTFKVTKLKKQLSLTAAGSATIIRDGVRSVYQQVK